MTSVNQVVATAAPADAVTGQAFAWQCLLRSWGYTSEIVAEHVHPELEGRVHPLRGSGESLLQDGPLVVRYSIWSAAIDSALRAPGPLALCYHNVTPGELLRRFHPEVAALCDRAREALRTLPPRFDALIADSRFNASDLREAGLGDPTVVPLLLDVAVRPPAPERGRNGPIVLSVGRVAPNKRLEDVVKAFTLYQRNRAPDASLVVVGSDDGFEEYGEAVRDLTGRIAATRIHFTGRISDDERDVWYARASAYLCMSVHEGFCAPIVEALAFDVPVVARAAGAVPETLGGAGIVLDGEDLALVAEALHEAVSSDTTRNALAAEGHRRLRELAPHRVHERIRDALQPVLAHA